MPGFLVFLLFIAFALVLVALILGLINPRLVLFWGESRTRGRAALIYGTTLAVLFLAIVITSITSPPESIAPQPSAQQTTESEHDAIEATVRAQLFVKQALKSPSTAKFPVLTKALDLGDGRYLYQTYVDSQNSFGAMVRSSFTCYVRYTGNGNWVCETLEFKE